MKAVKYLVAGALMLSVAAPTMAQDAKSDIEAISKVIIDNKGDVSATKDAVKQFTKVYKKNAEALAGLGRAFLDAKNYEQAKLYAAQARKVNSKSALGYLLEGDIAASQDNGGEAASWYEQATMFDAQNPLGYIKYARVYQKVDPDGAVAMLEKLRTVMPEYPVDAAAGYMYSNNGKLKTALQYYNKVSNVTAMEDYILYDYASTAYALEDYQKAFDVAVSGAGKYPEYSSFNRVAMFSSDKLKNYEQAVTYGDKLFNKKDTLKFIDNDYVFYADALVNLNRTDEAIAAYGKLKELNPERKDVNKFVADVYTKTKQYDKAVSSYNQYLEDLGEEANANHYRALADIYVDQIDGATEAQKQQSLKNADGVYATIESKFPYALDYATYQRALIHHQMNPDVKNGEAKPYYEKYAQLIEAKSEKSAAELKKLAVAYQYLAVYYIQNDNVTEAKAYANKLLEIKPEDETARQIVEL